MVTSCSCTSSRLPHLILTDAFDFAGKPFSSSPSPLSPLLHSPSEIPHQQEELSTSASWPWSPSSPPSSSLLTTGVPGSRLPVVSMVPRRCVLPLPPSTSLTRDPQLEATIKFLPPLIPTLFFFVHATLEIHAAADSLHESLDDLDKVFPDCPAIKGLRGLIHYHVRGASFFPVVWRKELMSGTEFDEATEIFAELQKSDPYRVEDIDTYSNILYVSEKRAELAMLAQEYTKIDRARPEVCCLVGAFFVCSLCSRGRTTDATAGNYYSLRREHEKAIIYFRRALKLDRAYLSAWTLMGHEYVEIKNTNAAIASYRRAVGESFLCDGRWPDAEPGCADVNRKDYRAWYGLGQTYELLGEPFYAINYYQKATALRFVLPFEIFPFLADRSSQTVRRAHVVRPRSLLREAQAVRPSLPPRSPL